MLSSWKLIFMRLAAAVAAVLLHLPVAVSLLTSIRAGISTPRAAAPSMKLGGGGGLAWRRRRPMVVGLGGGIASGKSTVSRALAAECGLEVIDADKLGHESYQPGTRCFGKLVDAFGSKIVAGDGTIDRRALGQAVGVCSPTGSCSVWRVPDTLYHSRRTARLMPCLFVCL